MTKHLNSLVLTICLALAGWVALKTAQSGEQIAAMRISLETLKESAAKTERKLDEMLPRREFDARLLVLEQRLKNGTRD